MKRLLIAFFTFYFSHLAAQTVTVPYQPGITSEGAVYFLPKTAIRITVQIEKTTYTPGYFFKYADRYLRPLPIRTSALPSNSTRNRWQPISPSLTMVC